MALSDLMQQPQDDPAALAALAQQFSSQDQASADAYAANGNAHSAPAPMPGVAPAYQGQALFPTAPQVAPAAPVRIPFPTGNASPTAGGVASPSLALIPGAGRAVGWQPTDKKTDQTTAPYSPETIAAKADALGSQGDQLIAQNQYDAAKAAATQQAGKNLGLWNEATAAEDRLHSQHQLGELHDYNRKIQNVLDDAANDKVDPMKWFNGDMNTGQKILFSLGSMASGFGYGYSGRGINPAQVIQDRIAASVDAQKQAHANKIQLANGMQNQYGRLREMFGDDESASKALQAAQLTAVMGHLDNSINDAATPYAAKLNAANIKNQLLQERAKALTDIDEHNIGKIATSSAQKYTPATAAGANIGVTVTLADGTRKVVPIATAKELNLMPKDQLEALKTAAETRKTTAEAGVAEQKAGLAAHDPVEAGLKEFASKVRSTRMLPGVSNPLGKVSGTEANLTESDIAAYNGMKSAAVIAGLGRAAERNQQLLQSLDKAFKIDSSMTPEEQQHKIDSLMQWHHVLGTGRPGSEVTTAGEGAQEQ